MTTNRTLHLLDVEYLGLGPGVVAGDLVLVLDRYRPAVGWHRGDHLVGAASHWVYRRIAFDVPSDLRLLPAGGGPDAADRRLADEAGVIDLTRYDRVVVASGDHFFLDLVGAVRAAGIPAWVAAYGFNTAGALRRAADRFVDLAPQWDLAA